MTRTTRTMAAADDSSPDHQRVVNRRAGNGLRLDEIRSKQIVVVKRSRKRSRSDVGEAGPSNAPASSVLAVRQVRKTWKKRKDYPSLRSRSSTSQFFEALQGLNAAQTAAIIEMGFASLFHLQIDNLPTKMGYWLVQNYNPRNSMLYLADGTGCLLLKKMFNWS
nr:Ribosomal protein L39e [Ipomoea batatas]